MPTLSQAHSPMSSRLIGFAAGAGHGSTYAVPLGSSDADQDNGYSSSYYHISTSTISVRHRFERRLVINPLITANPDLLWVDSYLGDYPQPLPHTQAARAILSSPLGRVRAAPKWMLLSLNKRATASSGTNASLAFNEDIRTWWSADTGDAGEWLEVDLGGEYTVNAVQINFADQDCSIVGERPAATDAYRYYAEYCTEKASSACAWTSIPALNRSANDRDMPHDYVELASPLTGVTHMRITNVHMPGHAKFSVSGFRVFGLGPKGGAAPAAVPADAVKAVRDENDPRHATVSWSKSEGAEFYVIRYGIASASTHTDTHTDTRTDTRTDTHAMAYSTVHNLQVYGGTTAEIRSLVVGQEYVFVVDAVNSNGVTYGQQPKN